MKITRIETFATQAFAVCRITDDEGRTGIGQLSPFNADIAATVLHRQIAPHVLGHDFANTQAMVDAVMTRNVKFPGTYICRALCGVDTAMWDLLGKTSGKLVCELLGGKTDPIAVYGSSLRRNISPADEGARIKRLHETQGYPAFKVRVGARYGGGADASPGRTEALIPTVRNAVGDKVTLLADANSSYSAERAIEVGRLMEQNNYFWFEEPCPYWQLDQTRQVTEALSINVAGGEQDFDLEQWKRMTSQGVMNIAQPDVCYLGGLTRALTAASLAEQAGMPCVPHSANHSMVSLFSMHLMAAIPNAGPFMEFAIEPQDGKYEHYHPNLHVEDGKVAFPAACAGWGVELNEDWLDQADRQVSER